MSTPAVVIAACCVITAAIKAVGPVALGGRELPTWFTSVVILLSPALLVLGSKASWWVPQWLDKILPHLDIEGKSAQTATATSTPQAPPVTSS